ncbi:hypothetical protein EV646_12323 [Kribbella antiqua]|uniref:Uncharacterized protein n=2 Tax=Kribbella antiqua TaxID=2512217 RepID=A0A4R2I1T9_9ACTN|nr:hypothetical protein EV646_12323 [Kribbella antiqua]
MPQGTLADLVSAAIHRATGKVTVVTAKSISDWECGWYTWPSKDVRLALCAILGARTPEELGFYKRRTPSAQRSLSLLELASGDRQAFEALSIPGGRSFTGVEVAAQRSTAEITGHGWLMVDPPDDQLEALNRLDRRSLLIATDPNNQHYVADGRRIASRSDLRAGPQPMAAANVLDDLTVGIIWAITNADTALLADDAQLETSQRRLFRYHGRTASTVTLDEVPHLNPVARHWLGSRFCAQHIARNLKLLWYPPFFWTRDQRGEEATSWLIWSHKFEYLQRTARRFAIMRRGFCIPESEVRASPAYERVMLLLAMSLMEAFGITVELTTDPSFGEVEGFVLASKAIVADWLRGPGLWYVDFCAPKPAYGEIDEHLAAESVIAQPTSGGRLQALAEYLNVPWGWFHARCMELAAAGVDGIAHPRSRLLSTKGLDTAIRYVAYINNLEGVHLARR